MVIPEDKPYNKRGTCFVGWWLKSKDDKFVQEFLELLADEKVSTLRLYEFIDQSYPDVEFGLTTFRMHRLGRCSCP